MAKKKVKKSGLYWHVHHLQLAEWCYSYDERKDFITKHKPKGERPTRLKWFQPIKSRLPKKLSAAISDCGKAEKALDNAQKTNLQAEKT